MSQMKVSMAVSGGIRKIWGVSFRKSAVVFITAIPILMFLQLQQRKMTRSAVRPQMTYEPYT